MFPWIFPRLFWLREFFPELRLCLSFREEAEADWYGFREIFFCWEYLLRSCWWSIMFLGQLLLDNPSIGVWCLAVLDPPNSFALSWCMVTNSLSV